MTACRQTEDPQDSLGRVHPGRAGTLGCIANTWL